MADRKERKKQAGTGQKRRTGAGKSAKGTSRSQNTGTSKKKGQKKDTGQNTGIPMSSEIEMVASVGLMLLLMLSNFGLCGVVGRGLSSFFFGIFGCTQYVMPVAFCFAVILLVANDYSVLAMKKCSAGFALLLMISAFAQVIYSGGEVSGGELFTLAIRDHAAGGILGGGIGYLLEKWFGTVGALIIICCVILIALVMLTQRSFVGFFQSSVKKMRAWFRQQKEVWRQDREERAQAESDLNEREEKTAPAKSFLKMKTGKKALDADKLRARQCEEKLRQIEETREKGSKEKSAASAKERLRKDPNIHMNVPVFTSSDEVKKKDSVQELHPEVYPFTADDVRQTEFDGKLDFTAFSFNSGKTPEEFTAQVHADARQGNARLKDMAAAVASIDYEKEPVFREKSEEELPSVPVEEVAVADTVPEEENIMPMAEHTPVEAEEEEREEQEDFHILEATESSLPEEIPLPELNKVPEPIPAAPKAKEKTVPTKKETPSEPALEKEAAEIRINRAGTPKTAGKTAVASQKNYVFPPMDLLVTERQQLSADYDQKLRETAMKLQSTLESFGVNVTITDISCGPTVTRYEMFPEQGTKVSKIVSLTDDIKLNLAAADIRIEAPIPGKAAIGIEVPNKENMIVHFRELIDNRVFQNFKSKLAFAVGKDIGGKIVVADLAKMPHLLIAGATGSGKSVCINTLIMSILFKATPEEVKLIMIDPKMVELSTYNGIPHLLIPVVTDPKKASGALNWAVAEMTERYNKFREYGVRNLEGYNKKVDELITSGEVDAEELKRMPQIVIIIDELADLMMVAPGEVEDAIVRLSQLARAAGIHLVIATQRPSVNVITGLIKANVPSRIAFAVSSGVDSRTIIDMNGAEKLLGKGDMLFYPQGYQKPVRVQGAFITDAEVSDVVDFIKEHEEETAYDAEVTEKIENKIKNNAGSQERDEYFEAAARFIMEKDKATIGMLQRMFKIGFNRAARIIDQLAEAGIVGPEEGTKPRKILMSPEQLDQYFEEYL